MLQSKSFVKKTKKGKVLKVRDSHRQSARCPVMLVPLHHYHCSAAFLFCAFQVILTRPAESLPATRLPCRGPHAGKSACEVWLILPSVTAAVYAHAQVVREHYLRDDIWSGSPLDPECDPAAAKLAPDAQHYLAVDTNVVLSQASCSCVCEPESAEGQRPMHNITTNAVGWQACHTCRC